MGIVVKWREIDPSIPDEYADSIDPGNLQKLKDGRIETQSWEKDEKGKLRPYIFRADLKIDHGNPATIRLTYPKKYNKKLVDKEEIVLGTFTFKVKDGEFHGTGEWVSEGKTKKLPVKWTDTLKYHRSLVRPQQAGFRAAVTKAYESRCAITGCGTEEALEAAHVVPVSEGGGYTPENGILLRRDIHRLFDLDLVAINPEGLVVAVSDQISVDYKEYVGRKVDLPPKGGPKACHFKGRWERYKAQYCK